MPDRNSRRKVGQQTTPSEKPSCKLGHLTTAAASGLSAVVSASSDPAGPVKRLLVLKVGTSTIMDSKTCTFSLTNIGKFVDCVCDIINHGFHVILVSSGAVGAGVVHLKLKERPATLRGKQAASAVGQCRMMRLYEDFFAIREQKVGQLILTRTDLMDRTRFLNFKNTLKELLSMNVLPIINENDSIATAQLRFGDNDTLAAYVSVSLGAQWLFLLTDVDCLYTANPRLHSDARPIPYVGHLDDVYKLLDDKENSGTKWGSGGMRTKIVAAKIATATGIHTALCHGEHPERILNVIEFAETHASTSEQWRDFLAQHEDGYARSSSESGRKSFSTLDAPSTPRGSNTSSASLVAPRNQQHQTATTSTTTATTHGGLRHAASDTQGASSYLISSSTTAAVASCGTSAGGLSHLHVSHSLQQLYRPGSKDGESSVCPPSPLQRQQQQSLLSARSNDAKAQTSVNNPTGPFGIGTSAVSTGGGAVVLSNEATSPNPPLSPESDSQLTASSSKDDASVSDEASDCGVTLGHKGLQGTRSGTSCGVKDHAPADPVVPEAACGVWSVPTLADMPFLATIFAAQEQTQNIKDQRRWILSLPVRGRLYIDQGAANAIVEGKKSLLCAGVTQVEGLFCEGEAVAICLDRQKRVPKGRPRRTSADSKSSPPSMSPPPPRSQENSENQNLEIGGVNLEREATHSRQSSASTANVCAPTPRLSYKSSSALIDNDSKATSDTLQQGPQSRSGTSGTSGVVPPEVKDRSAQQTMSAHHTTSDPPSRPLPQSCQGSTSTITVTSRSVALTQGRVSESHPHTDQQQSTDFVCYPPNHSGSSNDDSSGRGINNVATSSSGGGSGTFTSTMTTTHSTPMTTSTLAPDQSTSLHAAAQPGASTASISTPSTPALTPAAVEKAGNDGFSPPLPIMTSQQLQSLPAAAVSVMPTTTEVPYQPHIAQTVPHTSSSLGQPQSQQQVHHQSPSFQTQHLHQHQLPPSQQQQQHHHNHHHSNSSHHHHHHHSWAGMNPAAVVAQLMNQPEVDTYSQEEGELGRCLVNFSSDELDKVKGMRSDQFMSVLGYEREPEVAHRDNIIFVNPCLVYGCTGGAGCSHDATANTTPSPTPQQQAEASSSSQR